MNKKQPFSDQDLDALLESVDQTLKKAEALAKSQALKKDDGDDETTPPPAPADAPPQEAQPPTDDQTPPMDAPPQDDQTPPMEGQPEGEQALEGEQGDEAPLTDEELTQIYSSMPPEELERHFSVLRQALSAAYGDQGQEQMQDPNQAAAPQPPTPQPPTPQAPPMPQQPAQPEMEKSEKMVALEKRVEEQAMALEQITKAFEVLAKPQRKSITELQVMQKSESDQPRARSLSNDEIKSAYMKIPTGSLSKSERDMATNFFLHGEGKTEIEKLINSKGSK